ncbi:MAG TPA: hypothetical protein VGF75_04655, partial [Candidatus Saccharimonadales bacterium]
MATGIGLVPVKHKNGSPYNGECNMYYIPATDTSTIGLYEAVKCVNAMDAAGQVSVVAQAAAGDALIGSIVGFVSDAVGTAALPLSGPPYRRASTACYVLVADDPDLIFQMLEDAVGGVIAAADIGSHYNADLVVVSATANADTGTGISKTMLDSSTAAATSSTLKIVGVRRDLSNAAAQTG